MFPNHATVMITGMGIRIPTLKTVDDCIELFRLDAIRPFENGILIVRTMFANTENHFDVRRAVAISFCCSHLSFFSTIAKLAFGKDS